MKKPTVITISGKAGCGKTTFANLLKKEFELSKKKVVIMNNADYLKYILKMYHNWDGNKDKKGRELLQSVGTNIRDNISPDFWVNNLIQIVETTLTDIDVVIVADCRYPNEIDTWKERGYKVISYLINRVNHESTLTLEQQHHSSEYSLDNYYFSVIIKNLHIEDLVYTARQTVLYLL